MWDAVHKETERVWDAWDIWTKFEKPHKEEWYCCEMHKYPVTPIKAHKRKNCEGFVTSHFRMKGDHFCEGESDEHWRIKTQTAKRIIENKIRLSLKGHVLRKGEIKEHVEKTCKGRRADILFEFEHYNSLFGYGVVIEVAVSEMIDSLEKKAIDWINYGYSITYIYDIPNSNLDIKYPYGLFFPYTKWCKQLNWNWKKAKENGAFGEKIQKDAGMGL